MGGSIFVAQSGESNENSETAVPTIVPVVRTKSVRVVELTDVLVAWHLTDDSDDQDVDWHCVYPTLIVGVTL